MHHIFIHCLIEGHLGSFQFLAIKYKAAMKIIELDKLNSFTRTKWNSERLRIVPSNPLKLETEWKKNREFLQPPPECPALHQLTFRNIGTG